MAGVALSVSCIRLRSLSLSLCVSPVHPHSLATQLVSNQCLFYPPPLDSGT
jgi:hypothetical protein